MGSDYQTVLQRLKEERLRRGMAQRLLCYHMKMPQSHYSSAETGHKRFSYHETKGMCSSDVDVLYVFTGRRAEGMRSPSGPLETGLEETICLLNTVYILVSTAWSVNRDKASLEALQKQLEYIQCSNGNAGAIGNVFLYARNRSGYTQQRMASVLGVDIKKLRGLEKGRLLPDSEMIWKMYELFHISPAYILQDPKALRGELACALEQLDEDDRQVIMQILEDVHNIIKVPARHFLSR